MKKLLILAIAGVFAISIVGVVIMSFYTGTQYAQAEPEKFIVWEVDEVRVPVHHTDYEIIQVPVFYPKEVRVEVPAPTEFRIFETTAELKRWLDSKPILLVSGGDCDDSAMELVKEANKDGYYMFFYPDLYHLHFKCCAIAGNNVYLVEPQNHEIELYMRLD